MTDLDAQILAFEHRQYRHGGRKLTAIHRELNLSPTRYAQRLAELVDDPEAWALDPLVMTRVHNNVRRRSGG
jgi:hypothetical protein